MNHPVRILFVYPRSSAMHAGGLESFAQDYGSLFIADRCWKTRTYYVPTSRHCIADLRKSTDFARALNWADVIHAHDFQCGCAVVRNGFAHRLILTIHLLHALYPYYPQSGLTQHEIEEFEGEAIGNAAVVTSVSSFLTKEILERYQRPDVLTVLNGVTVMPGRLSPRRVTEPIRIAFVSRFAPQKGADLLPRVAASILTAIPTCRFHLLGDGPLKQRVKSEVEEIGLSNSCKFYGWVSRSSVSRVVRSVDLMLSLTRYEPFGLSVLESISVGKPVIGAIRDGMWEYSIEGINAFEFPTDSTLVDAKNAMELATQQSRECARDVAGSVSRFTWHQAKEKFTKIYISL